ncbi:putative G-protein coupled receptor 156 isoform X2 [Paroedura picta]
MSSPNLNLVTLLGSGLTYGSAYLFGMEKQNLLSRPSAEMLVQMRICLLCVGSSLAFGPILGKSWRLYKVFTQRVPDKRVIIKDLQLLVMVGALVGADVVLLAAWIFFDPVQCLPNFNAELKVTEKGLMCVVHRGYFCMSLYSDLWLILFLGFKGLLLMYGAYLAGLTYGVSSPPVNQSLTLVAGIMVIFLSGEITLVVDRFFHTWHNLVLGATSGGIFVCTTTINCLVFTPQVRHWKAFEDQNEALGHVAKFFTSSSKNFHSAAYSEEEIRQLVEEKHAVMQLLAEKETAIASLQEQVNSAKEKLTRLVAAEDYQGAAGSTFPSTSPHLPDWSAAVWPARTPEDPPADLSLPGPEQNSGQYYSAFSNLQCVPGSSDKSPGNLKCTGQRNGPPEAHDPGGLLNSARGISDCSGGPDDDGRWLFQCASPLGVGTLREPLGDSFSAPRGGAEQPPVEKRPLGVSYVSRDELQEVLQELSTDHRAGGRASAGGPEPSAMLERRTGWCLQEIRADALGRLPLCETRPEGKAPICLTGSAFPGTRSIMDRTPGGTQRSPHKAGAFPWAEACRVAERGSLREPCSSSPWLGCRVENQWGHLSREDNGQLLGKQPTGNQPCPGSPRTSPHRPPDFANYMPHLYPDSDTGSSSSSSSASSSAGGRRCCHRPRCEGCQRRLSSSSGSCSTDTDSEPGSLSGCPYANLLGRPPPVVSFKEDLEPTYV